MKTWCGGGVANVEVDGGCRVTGLILDDSLSGSTTANRYQDWFGSNGKAEDST